MTLITKKQIVGIFWTWIAIIAMSALLGQVCGYINVLASFIALDIMVITRLVKVGFRIGVEK